MLREMSAPQWVEWKAYMQLAPSGEELANMRAALIASEVWNVEIAKRTKRGNRPEYRSLEDFILFFGDTPKPNRGPTRKMSGRDVFAAIKNTLLSMVKAKT